MAELADWLNANQGVVTLGFLAVTLLALFEARSNRLATTAAAHVSFRADIDRNAGTTLRLRLHNHGPAFADDVRIRMQWYERDAERSDERLLTEPVLGVGYERVYIPDILLTERKRALKDMTGLTLRTEWSWLDDRHWFVVPWLRKRSRARLDLDLGQFVASMHGGPMILEPDPVVETLSDVVDQLKKINDRATQESMKHWTIPEPEARAHFERSSILGRLRLQRELWAARWRVWTRRR